MDALNLHINSHNVKDYTAQYVSVIRKQTSENVKNKIVSIEMDCATWLDQSSLGICKIFLKKLETNL